MARMKQAPNIEYFMRGLIGIPRLVTSEVANDSDITFNVPNNINWLVESIYVEYAATNDAGDRQLEIQILDFEGDTIGVIRAGKEQAQNTTRKYMFAPGLTRLTAFYDTDYLTVPLPDNFILREGWKLRVLDNNAVAVTADDFDIQMLVRELDTVTPNKELPATGQRNHARLPAVIQLTITPTAPIIESRAVIPLEQLTITTFAPHMGEHRNVGTQQLTITTTAPTMGLGITVPLENLVITPTAPGIAVA